MITRLIRSRRPRRGAEQGATAVEFAMVALPLFMMIMATLELSMVVVVSTMLESALSKAAREIRTGQQQNASSSQSADVSEGAFVASVCSQMVFLQSNCASNLSVDVRVVNAWGTGGAPDPAAGGTFSDEDLTFATGGPSEIVKVSAFYKWPLFTPYLSQALSKVGNNTALIRTVDTFRNEPYTS